MTNSRLPELIDIEQIANKKIIFIGLDGGSKRIIDHLISRNELPAIGGLIRKGSYFSSNSDDIEASSPVLWSSIASAKKPDKHGISSFYARTSDITSKRIWDIFNDLGFPVGVFGHFITWPPSKINGFMIPDLLALDNRCYPEEYGFMWEITRTQKHKKDMTTAKMFGYLAKSFTKGVKPSTLLEAGKQLLSKKLGSTDKLDEYFNKRVLKTKFHKDLFINLREEYAPKYSFLHIHLVDGTSHRFWKYLEPDLYQDVSQKEIACYKEKIYDAYRAADSTIQDIVDSADPDTMIVIASDHGFKASGGNIHWKSNTTLNVERFSALFDNKIRKDLGFSLLIPKIHLNIRNCTPEKFEYCKTFIESIEVSEYKKPLFNVFSVDDGNLMMDFNGEITEITGKHVSLNGESLNIDEYLVCDHGYSSGVHDLKDGIFIISGPDVKQNNTGKETVTICDIIPTVLALCNIPAGEDMDGSVITEAIEEDFLHKYPVQYIDTYEETDQSQDDRKKETELSDEETEDLKDQLKNLGYL